MQTRYSGVWDLKHENVVREISHCYPVRIWLPIGAPTVRRFFGEWMHANTPKRKHQFTQSMTTSMHMYWTVNTIQTQIEIEIEQKSQHTHTDSDSTRAHVLQNTEIMQSSTNINSNIIKYCCLLYIHGPFSFVYVLTGRVYILAYINQVHKYSKLKLSK